MEKIKVASMKTIARAMEGFDSKEWFLNFYKDHRYALDEFGDPITEREVLLYRAEEYKKGNWEEVEETVVD